MTDSGSFCMNSSAVSVWYSLAGNAFPFTRIVISYISETPSVSGAGLYVGAVVGTSDGNSVAVGISVVADVGDADGVNVGDADGADVGVSNGADVGGAYGTAVGDADGADVGASVGADVGKIDGAAVGNTDGAAVVSDGFTVAVSDKTTLILTRLLYVFFFDFANTVTLTVPTRFAVIWPDFETDTILPLLERKVIL